MIKQKLTTKVQVFVNSLEVSIFDNEMRVPKSRLDYDSEFSRSNQVIYLLRAKVH